MAYTTALTFQNPPRVFHYGHITPINGGSPTLKRPWIKPRDIQMKSNHMFQSRNSSKHILKHQKYPALLPIFAADSDITPVVPTLSDVIRKFYICINEKNLEAIEEIISNDCLLEDSTFLHSFRGKKEVRSFISKLVESMGENVHFRIGTVCEGDDYVASVDWHLEWKDDQIPFTQGCSIVQCSMEAEKLVIRKAQIISESPFKPGELGLGLLKILASFFDEFPKPAKWFLKSPHTIFKVVLSIYNLLFAPIMNPIFAFYFSLWKLFLRLLSYLIRILHFVAKLFIKMSSNGGRTTRT